MAADEVVELTYEGPPAFVALLAQILREEGLSVDYEPPFETRDAEGAMEIATVVLAVTGPLWPAIWAGVRKFRRTRLGSRTTIRGPRELDQSLDERLATLERLWEQGTITGDEYAKHRARMLDEL